MGEVSGRIKARVGTSDRFEVRVTFTVRVRANVRVCLGLRIIAHTCICSVQMSERHAAHGWCQWLHQT